MQKVSGAISLLVALLALLVFPGCILAQELKDDQKPARTFPHLSLYAVLKCNNSKVSDDAFGTNGSIISTVSDDGTARLWDSKGQPFAVLGRPNSGIRDAKFSPDSSRIITRSADDSASVYRVPAVANATIRNVSGVHALHDPVISADGAWMAAEEHFNKGDGSVRVWSTKSDVTFTIERGLSPRISRDSRWVTAFQKPPLKDSSVTELSKRAGRTLVLLDAKDGSTRKFEFVLSYDLTFTSSYLLYLQSPDKKSILKDAKQASEPTTKKHRGGMLHSVHLENNTELFALENVKQYAVNLTHGNHQTNDHFAYVLYDQDTARETLCMALINPGRDKLGNWGIRGRHTGNKIEGLRWAHDNATLVFFDHTNTNGSDEKPRDSTALYMLHDIAGRSGQRLVTRVDQNDSKIRVLSNPAISADGFWVAAEVHSDKGDGNVRVWSTESDVTFTIERGQNPRISRDSRWLSAMQKPQSEDSNKNKPKKHRAGQRLVLTDLQNGSQKTFDFVLFYDMTFSSTYLLYLQSQAPTSKASGNRNVGTLHQVPLNRDRLERIGHRQPDWSSTTENVASVVTHPTNDHFAYVVFDDDDGGDETLRICKWGIRAWYHGKNIEGLNWAGGEGDESIRLGFLNSTVTTSNERHRQLHMWQPGQSSSEKFKRIDLQK